MFISIQLCVLIMRSGVRNTDRLSFYAFHKANHRPIRPASGLENPPIPSQEISSSYLFVQKLFFIPMRSPAYGHSALDEAHGNGVADRHALPCHIRPTLPGVHESGARSYFNEPPDMMGPEESRGPNIRRSAAGTRTGQPAAAPRDANHRPATARSPDRSFLSLTGR